MMQDTLESSVLGEEPEEMEEEAQAEVDHVLYELTDGKLGQTSSTAALPHIENEHISTSDMRQDDMEQMHAALQGLLQGQ